jgi:type IV secretion system protein VirD4
VTERRRGPLDQLVVWLGAVFAGGAVLVALAETLVDVATGHRPWWVDETATRSPWRPEVAAVVGAEVVVAALVLAVAVRRYRRRPGFVSRSEERRFLSSAAVRRRARTLRPSIDPRRARVEDCGVYVGRSGGRDLWLSREESLLVFGPSGEGKTMRLLVPLCRRLVGPMIVVSTKEDLARELAFLPEFAGRLQWLVDLRGRAGLDGRALARLPMRPSGFDLVRGCEHPSLAKLRAQALVEVGTEMSEVKDGAVWKARAISLVTYALHAAALAGRDVRWVVTALSGERFEEIRASLQLDSRSVELWDDLVHHLERLPHETLGGVLFSAMAGLSALTDHPEVLALCSAGVDQLDVDAFLEESGVLFLIVSDERRLRVGPVAAALVEGVIAAAKARAQRLPGCRLDPPLAVVVDEMAQVPLPTAQEIAATGRSQGITPVFVWQTPAQVRRAYGDARAAELLDACTALLVLRGLRDANDLSAIEKWMPQVQRWRETRGRDRSVSEHREPAMTASDIRLLGRGEGLLFVRGLRPALVRLRGPWELPIWERRIHERARAAWDEAARRQRRTAA